MPPKRPSTPANRHRNTPKTRQKRVRKKVGGSHGLDVLKNNLGHLVAKYDSAGNVKAYEIIAGQLSRLAGLNHGHTWSWRYVESVHKGTVDPSKKFRRALELRFQEIKPNHRQWHYFACRNDVLSFYTSISRAEIIGANLKPMGYRSITYSRYMEIKKMSVNTKKAARGEP